MTRGGGRNSRSSPGEPFTIPVGSVCTRRLITAAIVSSALAGASLSLAQTQVPTGSLGDETWSSVGSPYVVSGDVVVPTGTRLLVLAGTDVLFAAGDESNGGIDPDRAELIVEGALVVEGAFGGEVTFRAQDGAKGAWYGIVLSPSSESSAVRNAVVRDAVVGLSYGTTRETRIELSTFENCSAAGISVTAGAPILDAITAADSGVGVEIVGGGSANLRSSVVVGNASHGLHVRSGAAFSTAINVFNCTLHGNGGHGIYAQSGQSLSTVDVRGSSLTSNQGTALVRESKTTLSIEFSNLWDNAEETAGVVILGPGMIAEDPDYLAAPANLALGASSPNVGAGTSSVALEHDRRGVRRPMDGAYDIGAYELVSTSFCGDAVIDPGESCDDGMFNGAYAHCNAACTGPGPRCGDGTVDPGEQCDDGNRAPGDACEPLCGYVDGAAGSGAGGTSAAGGLGGSGAAAAGGSSTGGAGASGDGSAGSPGAAGADAGFDAAGGGVGGSGASTGGASVPPGGATGGAPKSAEITRYEPRGCNCRASESREASGWGAIAAALLATRRRRRRRTSPGRWRRRRRRR